MRELSQGGLQPFPADAANGTELTNRPAETDGVRLELAAAETVVFFVGRAGFTHTGAPAHTLTRTGAGTFDEPVSKGDSIFCVSSTGSPLFRWIQR